MRRIGDGMTTRTVRMGIWCTLPVLLMLAPCSGQTGQGEPASVPLAKDGKAMATIVVAADAGSVLGDAVKDLQLYIKKISGAELPVANSAQGPGNFILVGRQPAVDELIGDLDTRDLGPDGIVIKSLPGRLVLTGQSDGYYHEDLGRLRGATDCGTPNAIYYFLESLGCRWYMPGEDGEVIPRRPTLTVSMDITSKPDFSGRWIGSSAAQSIGGAVQEEFFAWRARNRTSHNTYYNSHSMTSLFPKDKYRETHPEYFALVDGKRQLGGAGALCFSNPAVVDIVSGNLIEQMRRYSPLMRSYSLGQADGPSEGWCQCENCLASYGDKTFVYANRIHAAVVGRGASDEPIANAANGYLRFANAVAEKVEEFNPDLVLSYYGVQHPRIPRGRPARQHPAGHVPRGAAERALESAGVEVGGGLQAPVLLHVHGVSH